MTEHKSGPRPATEQTLIKLDVTLTPRQARLIYHAWGILSAVMIDEITLIPKRPIFHVAVQLAQKDFIECADHKEVNELHRIFNRMIDAAKEAK